MNIKQIRELAQILSQNELNALEIVEGDVRIRMEKGKAEDASSVRSEHAEEAMKEREECGAGVDFNRLTEIKSPMVGVFYAAPSAEAETYVKAGSTVKQGDVVCIVEAMKMMNEIVAEHDGTIVDICARNGDVVEYGQTLFKLS